MVRRTVLSNRLQVAMEQEELTYKINEEFVKKLSLS
jgi:hypothetical protein